MISCPRGKVETATKMVANYLKYHRECQEKKAWGFSNSTCWIRWKCVYGDITRDIHFFHLYISISHRNGGWFSGEIKAKSYELRVSGSKGGREWGSELYTVVLVKNFDTEHRSLFYLISRLSESRFLRLIHTHLLSLSVKKHIEELLSGEDEVLQGLGEGEDLWIDFQGSPKGKIKLVF